MDFFRYSGSFSTNLPFQTQNNARFFQNHSKLPYTFVFALFFIPPLNIWVALNNPWCGENSIPSSRLRAALLPSLERIQITVAAARTRNGAVGIMAAKTE